MRLPEVRHCTSEFHRGRVCWQGRHHRAADDLRDRRLRGDRWWSANPQQVDDPGARKVPDRRGVCASPVLSGLKSAPARSVSPRLGLRRSSITSSPRSRASRARGRGGACLFRAVTVLKGVSDGGNHDGHRSKQAPILRRWPEQCAVCPPRCSGAGGTAHAPIRATLHLACLQFSGHAGACLGRT